MKRVHLTIHGRVQGIFFRRNTKKIADKLELKGWVRNTDDSVEVVAEGKDSALDRLIEWCKKGPMGSRVDKVKIKEEKSKGEFKDFSIIY